VSRHRILGSAVLVYALLTSGVLLSVAYGWSGAVNAVLWLGYVLGGFGLVRDKPWGRVLTLLAAGGSLVAMVVLAAVEGLGSDGQSTAEGLHALPALATLAIFMGGLLGALPALAIFVAALLVKLPPAGVVKPPVSTDAAQPPATRERTRRDIAYVAFMVLGFIACWTAFFVLWEVGVSGGSTGGVDGVLGFLVLIPFGIPLLIVLVLGPGLSVFLWRDARLMTLTVVSIAVMLALGALGYASWPLLLVPYGVACIALGVAWFRRYRPRLA
jgi:hypothetical protein